MTLPTHNLAIRKYGGAIRVNVMCFPCSIRFWSPVLFHKRLGTSPCIMIMSCARTLTIPTGTFPSRFDDIIRKRYGHDISSFCDKLILSPNNKNVNIKNYYPNLILISHKNKIITWGKDLRTFGGNYGQPFWVQSVAGYWLFLEWLAC